MTDLVQKLVGALEATTAELESHQGSPYCNLYHLPEFKEVLDAARAALSAAKAGGWVAVPVEPTPAMLKAAHDAEHCGNHEPHFANAYRAMLAARPLPAPPAQKEPT